MILKNPFLFPISSSLYASFRIVYSALFSNSVFPLWPDFPFCLCDEGSSSRKELYLVLLGNRYNCHSGITFNYIFDILFGQHRLCKLGLQTTRRLACGFPLLLSDEVPDGVCSDFPPGRGAEVKFASRVCF